LVKVLLAAVHFASSMTPVGDRNVCKNVFCNIGRDFCRRFSPPYK